MNRVNKWLQNYLVLGLPFMLACVVWSTLQNEREILTSNSFLLKATWEVLSWNLVLWFISLVGFLLLMVFAPSTREMVTRRIANINERDEREVYITGQASRKVFISTLSVLIFLFFISIFKFNVSKLPPEQVVDNRARALSLGLNFKLTDDAKIEKDQSGKILLESKDIPLSKSAILLMLIIWQVATFRFSARKLAKGD